LVHELRKAKHNVCTVNEAGLRAASDNAVFDYVIAYGYIILTQNCDDFAGLALQLLAKGKFYLGLLLVYKDNNASKDMGVKEIVRAIKNLEKSKLRLKNQIIVLNQYNY